MFFLHQIRKTQTIATKLAIRKRQHSRLVDQQAASGGRRRPACANSERRCGERGDYYKTRRAVWVSRLQRRSNKPRRAHLARARVRLCVATAANSCCTCACSGCYSCSCSSSAAIAYYQSRTWLGLCQDERCATSRADICTTTTATSCNSATGSSSSSSSSAGASARAGCCTCSASKRVHSSRRNTISLRVVLSDIAHPKNKIKILRY